MGRVPCPEQTASVAGSLAAKSLLSVHPVEDVLLISTEAYINTETRVLKFSLFFLIYKLGLLSHLTNTKTFQIITDFQIFPIN